MLGIWKIFPKSFLHLIVLASSKKKNSEDGEITKELENHVKLEITSYTNQNAMIFNNHYSETKIGLFTSYKFKFLII
jgi:hypothetical protein